MRTEIPTRHTRKIPRNNLLTCNLFMYDADYFSAWAHKNLAELASDLYARNKELEAANDQLRTDLRHAMDQVRATMKKELTHANT